MRKECWVNVCEEGHYRKDICGDDLEMNIKTSIIPVGTIETTVYSFVDSGADVSLCS